LLALRFGRDSAVPWLGTAYDVLKKRDSLNALGKAVE